MSARKPLARMDSSTIVAESIDKEEISTETSLTAETNVNKMSTTENGDKSETTIKCEIKESEIKQEKLDFDEAKRVTRNSPLMPGSSPLKKKPSDTQEQDSSTESSRNEADETVKVKNEKPVTARGRKPLDPASKPSSTSIPPTNRLTRKAAMKDWAANTRLTRARRASAGMGTKSETPPKRKYVSKKNQVEQPPAPAVKRKRSISPKPNSEEPEAKIIKTEAPDFDIDSITIKQEILESSEEMTSDVASDITDMFPAEPSGRISLRARKTTMCYSPTTRVYRKDKDKVEAKKKKLSRFRPDEDSKDSMASSNIEDDTNETQSVVDVSSKADPVANGSETIANVIVDTAIKTPVEVAVAEMPEIQPTENPSQIDSEQIEQIPQLTVLKDDTTDSQSSKPLVNSGELIDIPLSVDTTCLKEEVPSTSAAAVTPEQSNPSEKSASLSPEMVSEGVCEISVKQFYKKPEFLENNLGIENDPKLGEIVQNVSERMDDAVDQTSLSNDSIKEGELVFEEEDEDEDVESIGTIKNDHEEEDEDANSVSTGFISPLLVEEEEEENEEQTFLNDEENVEETSMTEDVLPEEDKHCEENDKTEIKELEPEETKVIELNSEEITPEEITTKETIPEEQLPEALNAKSTSSAEIACEELKVKETKPEEMEAENIKTEEVPPQEAKVETPVDSTIMEKNEVNIEKTEICDKKIESDNEIKKDEELAEIKTVTIENKIELPEQEKPPIVKEMEMEVDEPKIETSGEEETKVITDQEENKENMELKDEAVKPEDCLDTQTKNPIEKESSADEQEESPSESSKNSSPSKAQAEEETSSGDATTPSTSPKASKSSCVPRTPENDEKIRQKERHLKTLGLLTHKAADEAIMAKQKRRKFLHNLSNNSSSKKNTGTVAAQSGSATGNGNGQNKMSQEYTGTLKTIIKINRQTGNGNGNGSASEPKKGKNGDGSSNKASTSGFSNRRQSLKMTFQKGRGRPANTEKSGENPANTSCEDSYYTIQNEVRKGTSSSATTASTLESSNSVPTTSNTGRKSYNRSNTLNVTDPTPQTEHHEIPVPNKKDEKEEILIPEKASSFKFHPGRLCQDQCYYCSGKFGLYDTPCHVGQIKSVERQQKILSNEEKLTVDNCLCDACFRHVDRRANVPSYKKRLSVPGRIETTTPATTTTIAAPSTESPPEPEKSQPLPSNSLAAHICAVPECDQKAAHSLRRKSIRKSVKKSLLNFDMSTATGTYLYICDKHYEAVAQSSGCVLCKRRLGKNNMYHITTDTDRLEKALADMGIPVTMGQCTAVCKLCRYFANLLMKPPEHGKVQKIEFVKNYRKRLLQFYNIHDKKDTSHDDDEEKDTDKEKSSKKQKPISTFVVNVEESTEIIEVPPSPTHSTGSSVEMISDGGLFSGDESSTAKKSSTTAAPMASISASNQMVLDNDVMVDYDVPMISDTSSTGSSNSTSPSPLKIKQAKDQQSKLKAILQSVGTSLEDRNDISTALRSNPNISMRELFPGEEDLGLQFKAPFGGRSSQRTPEGWTRINTFLQYDEPTRRLWEDLQKPYGNQSSFLRHLILLEKYYRNGDLILSSNASSNATVYTQTVRNRLTSFDSRSSSPSSAKDSESRPRSLSVDKIQRQLSSNSVTIIARPKDQPKEPENTKQKESQSAAAPSTVSASSSSVPNSRSILKANIGVPKGNSSIEVVSLNSTPSSKSNSPHSPNRSGSTTPNEGTMLTKQQKILAAANKLMSNKLDASPTHKKPTLHTTPPELISLNKRPAPALNTQPIKRPLLPKPMKAIPPNVVVLPDTLTAQERLESKSWRPTLLPVTTTAHHLNNQQGPLYQTADGRRLPALVQVQSGGRPFLISIHDYNRMCILRREKLMRDQMLKGSKGKLKGAIFPPATCTPSNNSSSNSSGKQPTPPNPALVSFNKTMQAVSAAEIAAKKQRLLLNKSTIYTPIAPKPMQTSTTSLATATCTSQTQSQSSVIPSPVNLKPISLLTSAPPTNLSMLPNPNLSGQALPLFKPTNTSTLSGVPTNSWLWNNFPDHNQMLMNGKSTTPSTSKGPQATFTTMNKQQSLLLDNSLMSKIPKSLTVIPQHKLMPAPHPLTGQMHGGSITKSKE